MHAQTGLLTCIAVKSRYAEQPVYVLNAPADNSAGSQQGEAVTSVLSCKRLNTYCVTILVASEWQWCLHCGGMD